MGGHGWHILILSLPTENATARMRIWRALKAMGCGVLRDGVYVLPVGTGTDHAFVPVAEEVRNAGGTAHVMTATSPNDVEEKKWTALFDRNGEYASLLKDIAAVTRSLARQSPSELRKVGRQLRRTFDALQKIDFFASPSQAQVSTALSELEATIQRRLSPDEPHAASGTIPRLKLGDYRKRLWATRKRPWVDRLASAWLIGRFIDPDAKFQWIAHPKQCPRHALGFDFDGATFTHIGHRVTFEVLLASFSLEADPALSRIGTLVHVLDTGGVPVPEAAGLEMILRGLRETTADDDRLRKQAAVIFDGLYEGYREETESDGH